MPSFKIPAYIFARLSIFDSPKGSSNSLKTHKKYFKRKHLIIYMGSLPTRIDAERVIDIFLL